MGDERYRVIRAGELQPSPKGTITFEGKDFLDIICIHPSSEFIQEDLE